MSRACKNAILQTKRQSLEGLRSETRSLLHQISSGGEAWEATADNAIRSLELLDQDRRKLVALNRRLASANAQSVELLVEIEATNQELDRQRTELAAANRRLAQVTAASAELVALVEEKNAALESMNGELARANAHGAELMAEIEIKDERITELNSALAVANARGAELLVDLEARQQELQAALERLRVLEGIITICAHCHKIRDDAQVWTAFEVYIQRHSDALFSHGLCPACLEKHYPDTADDQEDAGAPGTPAPPTTTPAVDPTKR
jgi:DNA repair exonuclease SbcCD ATPase subunit